MIGLFVYITAIFAAVIIGCVATATVVDWLSPSLFNRFRKVQSEEAVARIEKAASRAATSAGIYLLASYLVVLAVIAEKVLN